MVAPTFVQSLEARPSQAEACRACSDKSHVLTPELDPSPKP